MATGRIGTTPVLTTRWSKAPAAGTTSLSGLDDNSVSLVYSVGYEAVYQNGVLLSRGNDYTATNGTTITLTTATVAGDIIEVFANNVVPLTDTYSQSVADGKFVNNTIVDAKGDLIVGSAADTFTRLAVGSANQVLTVDSATTSGLKWATPSSGLTLISTTTFTNVASQDIDNVFSSTYNSYLVAITNFTCTTATDDAWIRFRYGTTTQASLYYGNLAESNYNGSAWGFTAQNNVNQLTWSSGAAESSGYFYVHFPAGGGANSAARYQGQAWCNNQGNFAIFAGQALAQTYTGIRFLSSSSNVSGTISIYGLAK